MKRQNRNHLPLAAFILMVLLGGFGAIGVRYTNLEIPPFWGASLRMAASAMLLFLLAFIFHLPFPHGRALLGAVLFGLLDFGGSYAFIYYGLEQVQPGMTMVLLALTPILTMLIATTFRQEIFRWRGLLGALLAVGGVGLVFQEQLETRVPFLALLSVVLGAVCIAGSSVMVKSFPESHPITTNAIAMAAGAVFLFSMSRSWNEHLALPSRTTTWVALAYLVLLGTSAVFILFLYILKFWTASAISYQFVLLPFVTITASAALMGETLNPILLVGAALVLGGVFIGLLSTNNRWSTGLPPAVEEMIEADDPLEILDE